MSAKVIPLFRECPLTGERVPNVKPKTEYMVVDLYDNAHATFETCEAAGAWIFSQPNPFHFKVRINS
jgi:hypothetical protein